MCNYFGQSKSQIPLGPNYSLNDKGTIYLNVNDLQNELYTSMKCLRILQVFKEN
jgi:hypothetical protein